ncbi:hypothetical protein A1O7_06169 [Cladophialophora yegresii CBS 114405]|uniref:Major facilitator superfamily (MFS) profile domain-containing protein n=1 Tax=Cladophialophora yegresii CBS 114405 TaxID=1182544 RepID=W9WJR4_9EURO|nr:uncharacterized protein A1O7_06169 [Cladophialophora yegresii CBS 114405]EXJ58739.1 hypothetical protein A1O7_06169 [Cladophialophora yegresii CBS 114405]
MAASSPNDSIAANWKCLLACLLIAMGPFQYGVDFGLIAGIQAMVGFDKVFGHRDELSPTGWNLSPVTQQLISSFMTIGAARYGFSTELLSGPLSTRFGRRQCVWLAIIWCYVSDAIMMGTTHVAALYVGRIMIGIANGWFMTFPQLYLQEVAPAHLRGFVYVFFQFWVALGSLIGNIVDNFTEKLPGKESYLIPLGIIYVVPLILGVGIIFIPESPRWLLTHGRKEEARKALLWLRPAGTNVDAEILAVETAHNLERESAGEGSWTDIFTNKIERRRTLLSLGSLTLLSAPGAMFMIMYGTYFFQMAGVGKPFEDSCVLSALSVVGILASSLFVTRLGRRTILMSGMVICGVMQLIQACVYKAQPEGSATGKVIVAMNIIYMFFYNACLAAYAWLVGGEMPSLRLRSFVFGLAGVVGFFWPWLSVFTAPYFINPDSMNWGPKYGFIWFPSAIVATAWIYFFLPEVKDRTLEEIDVMFQANLPARKFKGYVCNEAALGMPRKFVSEKDDLEVTATEVEAVEHAAAPPHTWE